MFLSIADAWIVILPICEPIDCYTSAAVHQKSVIQARILRAAIGVLFDVVKISILTGHLIWCVASIPNNLMLKYWRCT